LSLSSIAPRQPFAGYRTGPPKVPWRMRMSEPLRLTIVYAGNDDGSSRPGSVSPPELPDRTDSDSLALTIAA
jgi:hypothetical protein